MGAASLAGLTYLSWLGHRQFINAKPGQQMTLFNPIVKERLNKTFGYFCGAIGTTGVMMYFLRNSSLVFMNPWLLLGASMASIIGVHMVDYNRNWALKNLLYATFVGTISLSLVPLLHVYSLPIIYDAAIASTGIMGALGLVAYNSPSEQFLNWGGPLAIGCGGMLGISLLSMLYPGSPALTNIWLYGGLALFSAFVLYDTQYIVQRAKTDFMYDPVNQSMRVYMDAINIFVRLVMILGNSNRRK
jgi:FtsH-binding integral membrane protein